MSRIFPLRSSIRLATAVLFLIANLVCIFILLIFKIALDYWIQQPMASPRVVADIEEKLATGDFAAAVTMDMCMRRNVRLFVQELVSLRVQVKVCILL